MGKKKVLDAEQEQLLISLIHERPVIWNLEHSQHKNSYAVAKSWDEIAHILDFEKTTLKNKWKALKKRMFLEIKQNLSACSGSAADNRSNWQHYESLLFIRDSLLPKPPSGNLSRFVADFSKGDLESDSDTELKENQFDFDTSVGEMIGNKTMNKENNKKITKSEQLIRLENEKLQLMKNALKEKNSNSNSNEEMLRADDMLFFKTLRTNIGMIDPRDRLALRQDVTKMVETYAYKAEEQNNDLKPEAAKKPVAAATSAKKPDVAPVSKKRNIIVIDYSDSDVEIVANIKSEVKPKIRIKREERANKVIKSDVESTCSNSGAALSLPMNAVQVPYMVYPHYNFVQPSYNYLQPPYNYTQASTEPVQVGCMIQPPHYGTPMNTQQVNPSDYGLQGQALPLQGYPGQALASQGYPGQALPLEGFPEQDTHKVSLPEAAAEGVLNLSRKDLSNEE